MGIIVRTRAQTQAWPAGNAFSGAVRNDADVPADITTLNLNTLESVKVDRRLDLKNTDIPQAIRNSGQSICGIVLATCLDAAGGFRAPDGVTLFNLEQQRRRLAQDDVEKKKVNLKNFFTQLLGPAGTTADVMRIGPVVDKMDWPDFRPKTLGIGGQDVQVKFANEPVYSSGTGFYIGQNKIATAGHVVSNILGQEANYRVVFNMTGNAADHRVFSINRVVHYIDPNRPFPQFPTKWTPYLNDPIIVPTMSDFAVLELQPIAGVPFPNPLPIGTRPFAAGTDIYMIGSPEGLPLKYIDAGKIRSAVDETEGAVPAVGAPPGRDQSNFTVNIDMYGGNSGGPILDFHGTVVGLAMGANWEGATLSHDVLDKFRSRLSNQITTELRPRLQSAAAIYLPNPAGGPQSFRDAFEASMGSIPNGLTLANAPQYFKRADPAFTDFFYDLALQAKLGTEDYSDSKTWAHARMKGIEAGMKIHAATRADFIHFLNTPLNNYLPAAPPHLGGNVELIIQVNFPVVGAPGVPLTSPLAVTVHTSAGNHLCDQVFNGAAFVQGGNASWSIIGSNQLPLNAVPVVHGRIPPTVFTDLGGLHGWTSLTITRTGGAIVPAEIAPVSVRVFAQFTAVGAAPPGASTRRLFEFQVGMPVTPVNATSWIAQIGRAPGAADYSTCWEGPI